MIRGLLVELVSPAMVGGAIKNECDDPAALRPPSLRGHLRFWSRALGGEDLAAELWGTADSGQRVRLVLSFGLERSGPLAEPQQATLIPSRRFKARMVPPGETVLLRFALPDPDLLPRLQAVVWTWLHLGSVGRRSRRGYGSLRWLPGRGDLLAGWPPLWPSHHLTERERLEEYLRLGLGRVHEVLGVPGGQERACEDSERLSSLDQVFVGKELDGEWEAAQGGASAEANATLESLLHGLNENYRGDEPDSRQLGSGKPRRPSPMMWRTFPVHERTAVLPVMTWFPSGYESDEVPRLHPDTSGGRGGLYGYLHDRLGFQRSLTGGALFEEHEPESEERSG